MNKNFQANLPFKFNAEIIFNDDTVADKIILFVYHGK